MSKQGKERVETGEPAELTAGSAMTETADPTPSLARVPRDQETDQTEQSRQFNSWLDRALPRLMQYLAGDTTSAVTSPSAKAKH